MRGALVFAFGGVFALGILAASVLITGLVTRLFAAAFMLAAATDAFLANKHSAGALIGGVKTHNRHNGDQGYHYFFHIFKVILVCPQGSVGVLIEMFLL